MRHDNKGFSLIELLIVVAIIGIIATIAIPLLLTARDAAEKERLKQEKANSTSKATSVSTDSPSMELPKLETTTSAARLPTKKHLAEYARQVQPLLGLPNTDENKLKLVKVANTILAQYPPGTGEFSTRIDIPISLPIESQPDILLNQVDPWTSPPLDGVPYIGENSFSQPSDNKGTDSFISYLIVDPLSASLVIGRSQPFDSRPSEEVYTAWVVIFAKSLPFLVTGPQDTKQI